MATKTKLQQAYNADTLHTDTDTYTQCSQIRLNNELGRIDGKEMEKREGTEAYSNMKEAQMTVDARQTSVWNEG